MSDAIVQKILIDLETKKANDEMKKLAAMSRDTGEAMLRMGHRAGELQRAVDDIKKATTPAVTAFAAFGNSMKSIGAVMTPLNQGLALAGKAFAFAEEGLDAYAKTSNKAAGEVRLLTSEFARWKREVMEDVGEVAVALGQSLPSPAVMTSWAKRMSETGKSLKDAATDINKETAGAANLMEMAFGSINELGKLGSAINDVTGRATKGIEESARAAKKAAIEAARWRAEMAALGGKLLDSESPSARAIRQGAADRAAFQSGVDSDVDRMILEEAPDKQRAPDFGAAMQSLSESGSAVADLQQALADVQNAKNKTLFEAAFGPISEIDSYAESIMALGAISQSFSTAWQQSLQAIGEGSMSAGGIFKKGLGTMAAGIGQYLAAQSGRHAVEAAAHAVLLDFPGAARHAGAAVIYGGGAVAAYAVAAKLGSGSGGSAAAASGGGSGGGGSGGGADNRDHRGSGGAESTRPIVMVVGSAFDEMSPRQRAIKAQEAWDKAKRERDN